MAIFLTGVTGYVGKHLLRYLLLSTSQTQIFVCIRPKDSLSSKERFSKEIKEHILFKDILLQTNLKNVSLIEKDIRSLNSKDLESCTHMIHCAANVKFTSPFEKLMDENYHALRKLYKLCKSIKFIHISTCYVHPKLSKHKKAEKIPSELPKEEFVCDYAYTKYLAEQYLYKQKGDIQIIRLSCVGAPIENLPPIRGGAHLSILEAVERGSIPDLWIPKNLEFSVVPVDIACKGIIQQLESKTKFEILQFCAPSESSVYNISAKDILLKKSYSSTHIWSSCSYKQFEVWMSFFYYFIPFMLKKIKDINASVSYVSNNIRFESSLEFPDLVSMQYVDITIKYIEDLVKTTPKSRNFLVSFILRIFTFVKQFFIKCVGEEWINELD
jgi:nucleoside-diphosphate-sugar epimerase